jgi:hypothetical protein
MDATCISPAPEDHNVDGDPMLGPMKYNGGPTRTHALEAGSPAIDAGHNPWGERLPYDQRGKGHPRSASDGKTDCRGRLNSHPPPTVEKSPTPGG